jgi:hypothetical protein
MVKFLDDVFDPNNFLTTTNSLVQRTRSSFFSHLLRSNLNPCIKSESLLTKDVRRMFKILSTKKVVIKEQLSTNDEIPYKSVRIMKKINKLMSYTNDGLPEIVDDQVDVVELIDPSLLTVRDYPNTLDNTFMIIVGDCIDDNTNQTYDINIKSKFTIGDRLSQT